MKTIKAIFKNAWPYQQDKMNLPVKELVTAISFYETKMAFKVLSRKNEPYPSAVLERDDIQIGLSENGGDPTQDGCFFEVDNVNRAMAELNSLGLNISGLQAQQHGETSWSVFFIVAPDGLCYCIGERQG